MKPFEDELRSLLKREDPGEDFAERVLARVRREPKSVQAPQRPGRFRLRWLPALAVTSAMVCALLGAGVYIGYRAGQIRRGEIAKVEAIQALRIASKELNVAFERAIANAPRHASRRD